MEAWMLRDMAIQTDVDVNASTALDHFAVHTISTFTIRRRESLR